MKRRMGDTLTGGTRDVNPQYLTVQVVESAANTFTQATMALPTLRGEIGRGKYQVIELLNTVIDLTPGDGATGSGRAVQLTTSTQTGIIELTDPDLVDEYRDDIIITTSGLYAPERPIIHDFTDKAGHGIIIATQNMFVGIQGTSQTNGLTARVRIYYRFKNISVDEFVGLAIQNN